MSAAHGATWSIRRSPSNALRSLFARMLEPADVQLDGTRSWDPQIRDSRLFGRVLAQGSLGLGEAYTDGWWDCDRLDELVHRVLRAGVEVHLQHAPRDWWRLLRARFGNLQKVARAGEVARRHYDLGNDLFQAMLDSRAVYSCGYWPGARTLDEAQEGKLDLIARKLGLQPGMRVLDVGCGWGGAARFFAERHRVEVVGVTISREQARCAEYVCRGLPVAIELADYRAIEGRFDRVYSIGMFEHVGWRNHRRYMEVMAERLEPDGLFLLHTIGAQVSARSGDAWVARYVFPNSLLPSAAQIAQASEDLFVIEDWHNFGADYDATLLAWYRNFESAWPRLAEHYGESFRRMWRYYLLTSAGSFRARRTQLWQLVLSPHGVARGYRSVR
jgi:cyclopropane-fatty-acyl-phospholipid synthase